MTAAAKMPGEKSKMRRVRFAVSSAQAVRDYQHGRENYDNCASLIRTAKWIAAKQYSYSLGAPFRQECRREGYEERRGMK